jgi:hypothetical protein
MKQLLTLIAHKLPPSMVQNIIGRLGSKTPDLFKRVQRYSATGIAVCTTVLGILSMEGIDLPHEHVISTALTYVLAIFVGIGGAAALPTTDPKYIGSDVKGEVIHEAVEKGETPDLH